MTEKQRNTLLPQMTDDVAALVLRDNYFQTQALSMAGRLGARCCSTSRCASCASWKEPAGSTAPSSSCRPTTRSPSARRSGVGLTSPELAVLLAYSKMWLSDELVDSDLPEDPWVAQALRATSRRCCARASPPTSRATR